MKVVVGGGSGYIGTALVRSLADDGHVVVVVSRRPGPGKVAWGDVAAEVDGSDAVVNLAGTSIGGRRWGRRRKEEIRSSRVQTTTALVQAIAAAERKPRALVTASGIDYYGDAGDQVVDESAPPGSSFLARVVAAWEAAAGAAPVRHVALRQGFVIGRGAPALRLMALPYRVFVGGRLGSGRQWFPWIHVDDLVHLYRLALHDDSLAGAVNAVAPQQLRQAEVAHDFAAVLHRPAVLPTPAFALRLALGEQADLVLHGQRAVSRKLEGFDYRYRELRRALQDALG
jgi:uncharacterized protein (TIGR01777 family)